MRKICMLIAIALLTACNGINNEVKNLLSLEEGAQSLDLRLKIEDISFIPLADDNPDALFKGVNKCLFKDGRFYILDYMGTSSLTVFNEDGSFLFKIGQIGNGPGEYYEATDFDVSGDLIYLLDSKGRKINSYGLDGKFIKSYNYNGKMLGVNGLIVTADKKFLLGMDIELNSSEQVLLTDSSFTEKETILEFNDETTRKHLNVGCFRRCGSEIIYHYPVSDEIYSFDSLGKIEKVYRLTLDKNLSKEIKRDYEALVKARRNGEILSYFNETPLINNNFLVTTAFYKSDKAMICWNIEDNEFALKRYAKDSMAISLYDFNFPIYLSENRVVCLLDPMMSDLLDEESRRIMGDNNLSLLSDGVCFLVMYKLN